MAKGSERQTAQAERLGRWLVGTPLGAIIGYERQLQARLPRNSSDDVIAVLEGQPGMRLIRLDLPD